MLLNEMSMEWAIGKEMGRRVGKDLNEPFTKLRSSDFSTIFSTLGLEFDQ